MKLTQFAAAALPTTIRHALTHPHYAKLWARDVSELPADSDASRWAQLFEVLEPTSRMDLATQIPPVLQEGDSITRISHTSGSTSTPVYRYRSRRESEMVALLAPEGGASRKRALGLSLYAPYHGQHEEGHFDAQGSYVFAATLWEDHFLSAAINTLLKRYEIPGFEERVSFVMGSVRFVRDFTQALIDQGINRSYLAVRAISVFGGYLASEMREHLDSYWGFKAVDRFSISEASGGSTICPKCGFMHFDPHVLPALWERDFVSAANRSVGELTLTELYPRSICQPLVKYRSGDVVEVLDEHAACCAAHIGGFRHVGRAAHSITRPASPTGKTEVLLGSTELREAMYCPMVAKTEELPQSRLIVDRSRLGVPFASARLSVGGTEVLVSFRPAASVNAQVAEDAVRSRLLQASPHLRGALDKRLVQLVVRADPSEAGELYK